MCNVWSWKPQPGCMKNLWMYNPSKTTFLPPGPARTSLDERERLLIEMLCATVLYFKNLWSLLQWQTLDATHKRTYWCKDAWDIVRSTFIFSFVVKTSCIFLDHLSITPRVMCRTAAIHRWHVSVGFQLPKFFRCLCARFRAFCITLWDVNLQDGLRYLLLHDCPHHRHKYF